MEPDARHDSPPEWWVVLGFLRQIDRALLGRLGRKMTHHLVWNGIEGAERLLQRSPAEPDDNPADHPDDNRPLPRAALAPDSAVADQAFRLAAEHLGDDEILALIQSWIKEDKTTFLKAAVERFGMPLAELADALQRFQHGDVEERELSPATRTGLRAGLARRFLTEQPDFVNAAKEYLEVGDFHELAQRIVYSGRSFGRLGGKAAGLFLAGKVVARSGLAGLAELRVPRSWFIPSDGLFDFLYHNDLGEVLNRKYDDPDRVRLEYPHLVQLFKSSLFPPAVLRGLATVLDDLEGRPIIVRSSSLLEDRLGSAFSGKYKSLFLANTGGKRQRLNALTDAIAEVYASVFGPDPIEYRARRGFLDLHEEMAILIQEVVGRTIGPYFLPVFSGVAFCNNELRWSPRIRREDGLLRLVPGLGTRAVDRLGDDYPVLVAPGQPGLRLHQSRDEAVHYSPKKLDLIDLQSGGFETLDVAAFLAAQGERLPVPILRQIISIAGHDRLRRPVGLIDLTKETAVVTFEGLLADSPFLGRMRALLQLLREAMGTPVDVEFASDGEHLYLLQCRPQGMSEGLPPVAIPRDLPPERVLFTANRYVSDGRVDALTHVVYVDPEAYGRLDADAMREVGRAVGRLNRLLPRRQFALLGPGRWGSRGDIRLGVPVTYADLSNTAVLMEIARSRDGYVPDLSFGTHFFQDLVESAIRYLPLYPDDPGVTFNERFFRDSPNELSSLAPELAHLSEVVRVIDVGRASGGLSLRLLMNGESDEAVGFLAA
ncbi:MAG: PEP/pyruvate-binding domain-containing protein [Thermoanaerobaculia bacterium]